jgi:hypothetical protein
MQIREKREEQDSGKENEQTTRRDKCYGDQERGEKGEDRQQARKGEH